MGWRHGHWLWLGGFRTCLDNSKIVAVHDDPEFGGYTCIKGRQLPDSHNAAHRLTADWSVARMARSSKPRWPRRWLMSKKRTRRS